MSTFARKQKGISITGWIFIIAVALFFTLLGMKMVPRYLEFYSIKGILESIQNEPKWKKAELREIRKIFERRIDINSVYDFYESDPVCPPYKTTVRKGTKPQVLTIQRGKGKTAIEVCYTKREDLVGNVSVNMAFYKKVEL